MADDSKFNIILTLSTDKASAADILKILNLLTNQTKQLTGANHLSAAGFDKAFNAARKAAQSAKDAAAANKTVADVLKQIERQKALDELANKWAKVARSTKDAAAAQKGLQKELEALNATQGEIQTTAGQFAEGGGGGKNKLARLGGEIRQLPSIQTGLGFGTDAIGNLLRVGGAITGLSEKSAEVLKVTALLTPVLGANVAGYAALITVASAFVIPLAAIVLALKATGDEAAKQAEVITAILDAQRATREKINSGATSDDLQKEIEELTKARENEAAALASNQALYDAEFNTLEQRKQTLNGGIDLIKIFSGAEQGLADDLDKGTALIVDYDAKIAELTRAMEEGETAANDAAAAELKLAEERTKAVLESANAAGQEVQFKQRANKATFEQNTARLQAIEDERAAIQAQLDVLVSSGDTSEEVTSQIEKLNGSLNSLGRESEYISSTALAASKARDAEAKAIKEAEKAREEAQRKQEQADAKRLEAGKNYSKALIDIATRAADSAEDALRGMKDKLTANQTGFDRDITALSVKAGQSRIEAEIEAQQEEAADLREHQRKLESIRDDALADEDDALKKRDFLGAARIREAANRELEAENKAFQDGQTEKGIALAEAAAKEDRELDNARQARFVQLQQQNEDARIAYDNRLRDDRIAQDRSERDAATARDRELQAARDLADGVLAIKGAQAAAELGIAQGLIANINAMMNQFQAPQMAFNQGGGNNTTNQNIRSTGNLNFAINGAASPANIQAQMMNILGQVGLMPDRN